MKKNIIIYFFYFNKNKLFHFRLQWAPVRRGDRWGWDSGRPFSRGAQAAPEWDGRNRSWQKSASGNETERPNWQTTHWIIWSQIAGGIYVLGERVQTYAGGGESSHNSITQSGNCSYCLHYLRSVYYMSHKLCLELWLLIINFDYL